MLSAICFNLDESTILSSSNGLRQSQFMTRFFLCTCISESYLGARMIVDKGCELEFQGVCERVRALCNERRITVEVTGFHFWEHLTHSAYLFHKLSI